MPIARKKRDEKVWSEPITKVSKRYNVSDSFLIRICKRLNIPRPPRGYWLKLPTKKENIIPPLPEAQPGDEIEWASNGRPKRAPYPLPQAPVIHKRIRSIKNRPEEHQILSNTIINFKEAKKTAHGYLKPAKKLLPDLIITEKTLPYTFEIANQLYIALEDYGYQVTFAPRGHYFSRCDLDERENPIHGNHHSNLWCPGQPTLVFIGTVAIGLTIFEMTELIEEQWVNGKYIPVSELSKERVQTHASSFAWTTMNEKPTGRLCLQAYSPYKNTKWKRKWSESKIGDLQHQFKSIIKTLENEASTIAKLVEEEECKAVIRQKEYEASIERWHREEIERQKTKAIKESKEELLNIINEWAEAKRIDDFFKDLECRSADLSENHRNIIKNRLKQARSLLDSIDMLERFNSWKSPSS